MVRHTKWSKTRDAHTEERSDKNRACCLHQPVPGPDRDRPPPHDRIAHKYLCQHLSVRNTQNTTLVSPCNRETHIDSDGRRGHAHLHGLIVHATIKFTLVHVGWASGRSGEPARDVGRNVCGDSDEGELIRKKHGGRREEHHRCGEQDARGAEVQALPAGARGCFRTEDRSSEGDERT